MTQLESQPRAADARERRPVVVCIDDDPSVLRALRRVLRADDYEVLTTADPETALDRILRPPVDVFIADERMPGIRGTDLLRVVEQQSPGTRRVIISAYPEATARERTEPSLVQHFIPKPWNDELLKAIVRRMTAPRGREGPSAEPLGFMKEIPILADCAGRKIFQIVPRILKLLRKARRTGRPILAVLEDLGQLNDDPSGLLADLELGVTASNVEMVLVDRSGLALKYTRLRGSPSPLLSIHGPSPTRPARNFLLVDGETPRRTFLKLLLGGLGHSCRAVATIPEARSLAEREAFDRILVDFGDDHDAMDWIEEISGGGRGVRIVPLLPASRHWDPAVFERWHLQAPMIRPYSFREVLGLSL